MVLDCPFDLATLLLRKVSLPQPFLAAVDGLISDLDVLFVLVEVSTYPLGSLRCLPERVCLV